MRRRRNSTNDFIVPLLSVALFNSCHAVEEETTSISRINEAMTTEIFPDGYVRSIDDNRLLSRQHRYLFEDSSVTNLNQTIVTSQGGLLTIDDPQANPLQEPIVFSSDYRKNPLQKIGVRGSLRESLFLSPWDYNSAQNYGDRIMTTGDWTEYEPIRISLDTDNFINNPNYNIQVTSFIQNVFPEITKVWIDRLSVIPVVGNLILQSDTCGNLVTIPDDHKTVGVLDADLIIYIVGTECFDEFPTYAYGAPCEYDQFGRPIAGYLAVCLNEIEEVDGSISADQYIINTYVQTHEIGHILGFLVELFPFYFDLEQGRQYGGVEQEIICTDGTLKNYTLPKNVRKIEVNGGIFYELISHTTVQVTKNIFACDDILAGLRISSDSDDGCIGGPHWSPRIIDNDLMSPINDENVFNELETSITPSTLALFEDTGWYKANFTRSSPRAFGFNAGCSFLSEPCLDNGTIPEYSVGSFCNISIPFNGTEPDSNLTQYGCDSEHRRKAVCDLVDYLEPPASESGQNPPPEPFQYFSSPTKGAYFDTSADYCPRITNYLSVDCSEVQQEATFFYDDFGENSRCFETDQRQSVCLSASCNVTTGKIEGFLLNNDQTFVCEYDGQVIDYEVTPASSSFKFICPQASKFCKDVYCPDGCSGRGYCDLDTEPYPTCKCMDENDESDNCSETLNGVTIASNAPSITPTVRPSLSPTLNPTLVPSTYPSFFPTASPSSEPTNKPTETPSTLPSLNSSSTPSTTPSLNPTLEPSSMPSIMPSSTPSFSPTLEPSLMPSTVPTSMPTLSPSITLTLEPSSTPSITPTLEPSLMPSTMPTLMPSTVPSTMPTLMPSTVPTLTPSSTPSYRPSWGLNSKSKKTFKSKSSKSRKQSSISTSIKSRKSQKSSYLSNKQSSASIKQHKKMYFHKKSETMKKISSASESVKTNKMHRLPRS